MSDFEMEGREQGSVDASSPRDSPRVREDSDSSPSPRRGGDSTSPRSTIKIDKRDSSAPSCNSPRSGRRLFDIIQQVHHANRAAAADGSSGNGARWRSLRNRFRRAGAAWSAMSSGNSYPISDPEVPSRRNPVLARAMSRTPTIRNPYPISDPELVSSRPKAPIRSRSISHSVSVRNSELAVPEQALTPGPAQIESPSVNEDVCSGGSDSPASEQNDQAPMMSLMALLEQTDMDWGGSGKEDDDEDDDEEGRGDDEEDEDEEDAPATKAKGGGDGMLNECCVCMVRHKGKAFVPCGHSFCRLCSRELWVSHGNCPLCNGYILEILDIF